MVAASDPVALIWFVVFGSAAAVCLFGITETMLRRGRNK